MNNETKRDVFEQLLNEHQNLISKDNGMHINITTPLNIMYDNALPDNLPVIPKVVGDVIVKFKHKKFSLSMSYDAVVSVSSWMTLEHEEDFARAWVLGIWCVEETGEIVKLEVME